MRKINKITTALIILLFICQAALGQNKPNINSTKLTGVSSNLPSVVISGTDTVSYVRSFDFFSPLKTIDEGQTNGWTLSNQISVGNVMQSTQYVDGLGRPIQTVARKALPGGNDLVQFMIYDDMGRQVYQPMPFQSNYIDGRLHLTPSSRQGAFLGGGTYEGSSLPGHYGNEDIFYGLTEYDDSPLNRAIKQMAPGNSWAGNGVGVGVSSSWRPNTSSDGVRIWTVSTNPASSNTYAAGTLMGSITTDEEGHQVKQFTDKLGRVILKQVQKGSGTADGHSDWLNTYYVYDSKGNLSFVLPPRAVELLAGYGSPWAWNATDMNELVFKYTYDSRNRMITKEVPGGGLVEMVYDKLDRLVATRDANMENNGEWLITKYDALGRPVITGIYTNGSTRAALQTTVDSWNNDPFVQKKAPVTAGVVEGVNITISQHVAGTTVYKVKTGGEINFLPSFDSNGEEFETVFALSLSHEYTFYQGYYDATFPTIDNDLEVLSVSYFDDFDFTTQTYDDSKEVDFYAEGANNAVNPDDYADVTGMATGSKVKVLGTTDDWLTTVMFYDDRGRVIQSHSDNHVGGRDISTTQYDFSGKVLNTYTVHNNPKASGNSQTTIAKRYTYDGAGTGRLLTVQEKLNNTGSHKVIASNTYNDLGELESKELGVNPTNSQLPLETLNYDYNIRGWLEGINEGYVTDGTGGHYFGMDLSYDFGFSTNQLNGNIAGVKWRSASNGDQRAYGFDYDASNRLTNADYSQGSSWVNTENDFTTNYSYDANGNMLSLMRKGVVAGSIQTIDDLTYNYLNSNKSNQLASVSDAAGDLGQGDFVDGNTSGNDYTYDANGNMTQDKNKDILGSGDITYNHLNLPERIEFSNNTGKTIEYVYDAAGIKLQKKVSNSGVISTTDYVGGFIYENDQLQHFAHEEGRVRKNYQGNLVYDYFVKDHLGNTRMTLTEDQDVTIYLATMETEFESFEETIFFNLDNSRVVSTAGNYTLDGTITANEASRLNGSDANRRVGPGKLIAVSPGDDVDLEVFAHYSGTIGSSSGLSQAAMVTAVAATFGGVSGGGTEQQAVYNLFNGNGSAVLVGSSGNGSQPRGYLNYILFDQDFNYLDAGFDQVSSAANGNNEKLTIPNLNFTEGGYLYVYVSNESNTNFDVFFDDLRITHNKGAILQEDHYYPFGMNINALSSTAPLSKPNQFKYNGKEREEEFDLNWDEYEARMYMSDLGRWGAIDIMIEKHYDSSPYTFVYNNPVRFSDQFGLDTLLVDRKGRFADESLKGGENDVIITVSSKERKNGKLDYNKKGSLRKRHKVSKGFETGSIKITSVGEKGTIVSTSNEQSKDVFNFLADNTEVEFARIENKTFGKVYNTITTSHELRNESLGSSLINRFIQNDLQEVISHTHSHPINSGDPSKSGENDKGNDINAYKVWSKRNGKDFKVYIRYNGVTREFTMKGKEVKPSKK